MKKAIVLLLSVLLMGAVAFSANANIRTTATPNVLVQGIDQMQMQLYGAGIAASSYIDVYLDNVANFKQVNFYVTEVSSGAISTANMQPIYSSGKNVTGSVTLTSGTDMTNFTSMYYRMRIFNPTASNIKATMNILVTK